MPKLLLINPNTTASMTAAMTRSLGALLPSDSSFEAKTSAYGPASIEGHYDAVFAIPPMLEIIRSHGEDYDGIIIACFDDTGVEAARSICDVPVMGICQAACFAASIAAASFSIITTMRKSVPILEARVSAYGFANQCKNIRASEVPVLELEHGKPDAMNRLYTQCERAIEEDQCEALILGCAGMTELQQSLQQKYGLPVIEGVSAAVTIVDAMARLPYQTSRIGAYAKPSEKAYSGIFKTFSP